MMCAAKWWTSLDIWTKTTTFMKNHATVKQYYFCAKYD